ncbi:DUF1176 domain-containing protein [Devosia sp. SL43]|uniref:DUF1176 domain-containing protein n=1 Tax=Devosia sp. SL43 TaxID=2806348 RepID=UPI001F2ED076|nr:DUF1176 domain-containing protein [Devosia sp. SL43]UJW84298.1 hypothetical protein IM737_12730 [Devosia sp. SL43]
MLAGLTLAVPALAAPWGTDYNMGTFAAGGGSEQEGWLSLECGDPQGGLSNFGELYLLFTPAAGASFNKKQPLTYLTFTIGAETFDLPIELEPGSSDTFAYMREAEGSILTQGLVSAMRNGESVQISLDGQQLGDISLEGSDEALEAIDECIRFRS